ncbi:MAG: helix-turn-helix domain-containing protein [Gemmiger sp.]
MDTGILLMKEYGHVEIRLRALMEQRHISRNRLARMIDVRYEVVDKWYKGHVERIDADILARLCYVLDCSPGEIICYIPGQANQ